MHNARNNSFVVVMALAIGALVPAPAHAVSRCDVLERAQVWVDTSVMYSWDAWFTEPTSGACCYRTDCSAFVSAVWGLDAPGHTTYSFAGGPWDDGVSYVISPDELQPGDALNYPGDPGAGTGHVMLYIQGDVRSGHVEVYEEYGHGHPAVRRWRTIDPNLYLPIRFRDIEPCNEAPTGWVDATSCERIGGWAQDADAPDAALDVHLYFDGPAGSSPLPPVVVHAGTHRDDLCSAIGSCAHGFSTTTPAALLDGRTHTVFAYAIDTAGGPNPLLQGAPTTFACDAPALPVPPARGVLRHVVNPDVFGAWHFASLQVQHVDDAVLSTYPHGADVDTAPSLVRADDAPAVFVRDGASKRWVTSVEAMDAWRFSFDDVTVVPGSALVDVMQGPDLPAHPTLLQGSGPAVYLLDVRAPDVTTGDAATDDATDDAPNDATNDVTNDATNEGAIDASDTRDDATVGGLSPSVSGGCSAAGSSSSAGLSPAWALLFGIAASRRRRR